MKIERLIQIFEQLLPIYEKAYKEKWEYHYLKEEELNTGLCKAAYKNNITNDYYELNDLFDSGYYQKITRITGYILPWSKTWRDLKPRIDFMKSEIKDLKKLLKQGYTDV